MGKNFSILLEILFTSLHLYCGIWGRTQSPATLAHISFLRDSQSPLGLYQSSSGFEVQTVLPLSLSSQSPSQWHLWCKEPEIATLQSSAVYATMINKYVSPFSKDLLDHWSLSPFICLWLKIEKRELFISTVILIKTQLITNWMVKILKVYFSFINHECEWWFSPSVRCKSA